MSQELQNLRKKKRWSNEKKRIKDLISNRRLKIKAAKQKMLSAMQAKEGTVYKAGSAPLPKSRKVKTKKNAPPPRKEIATATTSKKKPTHPSSKRKKSVSLKVKNNPPPLNPLNKTKKRRKNSF